MMKTAECELDEIRSSDVAKLKTLAQINSPTRKCQRAGERLGRDYIAILRDNKVPMLLHEMIDEKRFDLLPDDHRMSQPKALGIIERSARQTIKNELAKDPALSQRLLRLRKQSEQLKRDRRDRFPGRGVENKCKREGVVVAKEYVELLRKGQCPPHLRSIIQRDKRVELLCNVCDRRMLQDHQLATIESTARFDIICSLRQDTELAERLSEFRGTTDWWLRL